MIQKFLLLNVKHLCVILPSHVAFICVSADVLDLALEIFNKYRLRQQILPLASLREFLQLYCENYPKNLIRCRGKSNTFNLRRNRKVKNTELRGSKLGSGKQAPHLSPDRAFERQPRPTTVFQNKKERVRMEIRLSRQSKPYTLVPRIKVMLQSEAMQMRIMK